MIAFRKPRNCSNALALVRLAAIASLAAALIGCQMLNPQGEQANKPSDPPPSLIDRGVKADQNKAAEIDPTRTEERDDIFEIASLMPSNPWLRRSGGKVIGLKVPAYFVSGETRKGAFVPGTILAWVYGFQQGPDGKIERKPLHIWEYPRNDAVNFRVRKKTIMGFPYQFYLTWPEELDLSGQYIELELGYERATNKGIVTSAAKRLKVPAADSPPVAPPITTTRRAK